MCAYAWYTGVQMSKRIYCMCSSAHRKVCESVCLYMCMCTRARVFAGVHDSAGQMRAHTLAQDNRSDDDSATYVPTKISAMNSPVKSSWLILGLGAPSPLGCSRAHNSCRSIHLCAPTRDASASPPPAMEPSVACCGGACEEGGVEGTATTAGVTVGDDITGVGCGCWCR